MNEYDVVVVGGGAAGLSAALLLTRARRRVAVVGAGTPRNAPTAHVRGFLPRDGMPPADLLTTARSEIIGYGGEPLAGTVVAITPLSPMPVSSLRPMPPEAVADPAVARSATADRAGVVERSATAGRAVTADRAAVADGAVNPPRSVSVDRAAVAVNAGFRIRLASGTVLTARRVIVATGLRTEIPDIPGLAERWGLDVLHCPYRHGYEVRDHPLGVLGGTPESVRLALLVRQWSDDVVFFAHTGEPTGSERQRLAARGIRIVAGTVTRVINDGDRMAGVELDWASMVAPHALFVRPRPAASDALLTGLGAVVIDERTGRTSVPGIWAAGNAVDPGAQMITAAGAGSAAAVDLHADLVDEDVRDALPFSAAMERRVAARSATSL